MNKTILIISSFVLVATLSLKTQADNIPPTSGPMQGSSMMNNQHPCHVIVKACQSAGFVRGGYKTGKGLFKNCMKPIMSGQAVSGVTVNPSDVQACQAKRNAEKNEKK